MKAVQAHAVDESSIPDLLDTMHIYTNGKDDDTMDVLGHPLWDKMMLVKPQPIPLDSFFDTEEAKAREEDFEGTHSDDDDDDDVDDVDDVDDDDNE